jgi:hypothetical protein
MKTLKLKSSFPLVWGDLAFQNQLLRQVTMAALLITILSMGTTLMLLRRKVNIIALNQRAEVVEQMNGVSVEQEVERAARRYVDYRYVWQPSNQAANLAQAKDFIAPQSVKAFEKTAMELVNFSKGKGVAQRIYPTSIIVDAKSNRVRIVADRFTEIQGLKAATYLQTNLSYQTGPRTSMNPWGIYIIKEEEVQ